MDDITRQNAARILAAFIVSDGTNAFLSPTVDAERILKRAVEMAQQIDAADPEGLPQRPVKRGVRV